MIRNRSKVIDLCLKSVDYRMPDNQKDMEDMDWSTHCIAWNTWNSSGSSNPFRYAADTITRQHQRELHLSQSDVLRSVEQLRKDVVVYVTHILREERYLQPRFLHHLLRRLTPIVDLSDIYRSRYASVVFALTEILDELQRNEPESQEQKKEKDSHESGNIWKERDTFDDPPWL